MDSSILNVNEIQDLFSVIKDHKIKLPQIVVVGSQCKSKSFVLESLVNKSFLPRETDMITRVPLILQMIHYNDEYRKSMLKRLKNNDVKDIFEWASFLHLPDKIFYNFDDVRIEIKRRTDEITGDNKKISHEPITLKVFNSLYNLTLVDLPGITNVPMNEQLKENDEQIRELILKYVQNENSIILAVITANSTNESLEIAKKVDPYGERTITVMTNNNIFIHSNNDTLLNSVELFFGNKILTKLDLSEIMDDQNHINDDKSLAIKLQIILNHHIQKFYPTLQNDLYYHKTTLENELKTFKRVEINNGNTGSSFIVGLLRDISQSYSETIRGNRHIMSDNNDKVVGGIRISEILYELCVDKLSNIDPLFNLSDEKIRVCLQNTAATKISSFISEKTLEKLVSEQLENLIIPSHLIVDIVYKELLASFESIDQNILKKLESLPKLNKDVRNVLNTILKDQLTSTKELIKTYIDIQRSYLNTTNPDLIKTVDCINEEICKDINIFTPFNDFKRLRLLYQINKHKRLTSCYFDFIRNEVKDFVPKTIKYKMVDFILNKFGNLLFDNIYSLDIENKYFEVVNEEYAVEEKHRKMELLKAVNKALIIIDKSIC